jgi:sialate O-acetylesterase
MKIMNGFAKLILVVALSLCAWRPATLLADVKPASIFNDHMVLQQGMSVPVWGWADPGEQVSVSFADQKQTAVAGADGKWMVHLANLKIAAPAEMTLSGKNSITIKDVLVGEVWLGSGQSNMEFTVSVNAKRFAGVNNETQEIAAADYPTIRMYTVQQPVWDSKVDQPFDDAPGHWDVCSPKTVGAFSAVGYFFSRQLQKAINQPIGFINTSYGASVAQAWISKDVLSADPRFKPMVESLAPQLAAYDAGAADRAAARAANPAPIPQTSPASRASTRGARGGRGRGGARGPANPRGNHSPYMLWNSMLHPVQPYAIRGVLWYQGESIIGSTETFSQLNEALITSWRREWGEGDFPFYFVQLAAQDANSNRPEVREAQAQALKVPNTAMAVTIDIGDKTNVHPKNKQELGDRLARIARANVYGEKIEFSGPMVDSMQAKGNSIRINFTHVGAGLMAKDGGLKTFEIAGSDNKFVQATAKIDGDTIVVSSDAVAVPTVARYAWNRWPEGCNLYNKDGLPAAPFRTDTK